ncbi:hypothetical protein AB0E27_41255 [Streptomyces sparsogenes]|uniref:hypothetical protein n=1 Tax=Streptomyces sparsogenes TaxID=67365 RepID=UPI0033C2F855
MAAAEMTTTMRTAHIRVGYHPEDAFTGVTLTPPPAAEVWFRDTSGPGRYGPGTQYRYWFALDLNTGELWYGDTDYRHPDEHLVRQLPGYLRQYANDLTVPRNGVMARLVTPVGYSSQHGYTMRVFTAEELYEVATSVLPIVQRIVDTMHRVGPRGELEWSAAADSAWNDFQRAVEPTIDRDSVSWPEPVISPVPDWRHEAAEFLQRHPELIPAEWATASDAELDRIAAYDPPSGYRGVPGFLCTSGNHEIYEGGWGGHSFYGHRAALYAYRAQAAGDRTSTPVEQWLQTEAGKRALDAATTEYGPLADQADNRLTAFADRLQAAATVEQLLLTGVREHLNRERAAERRAVEDLLQREGSEVARLEALLKQARDRRRTHLVRVLAWTERSDRELGTLASMSHTAVGDLREKLAHDDEQED